MCVFVYVSCLDVCVQCTHVYVKILIIKIPAGARDMAEGLKCSCHDQVQCGME